MTPLRFHLRTREGIVVGILGCLAVTTLGIYIFSQVIHKVIENGIWDGLFGLTLGVFFALGVTVGGLMGVCELFEKAIWIEVGPRLAYRTLTTVHTHEWADVESIQVTHTVVEQGDEEYTCYSLSASLVLTLSSEKKLDLGVDPDEKRGKIVGTLVLGLGDDDALTRRCCAEALGRLRTDAFPDLQVEMKRMCVDQRADFEVDAAQAKRRAAAFEIVLRRAVPRLKTATKDTDEDVRNAASEALHRWERTATFPIAACGDGGN